MSKKKTFYHKFSTCLRYFFKYGYIVSPLYVSVCREDNKIYLQDNSNIHASIDRKGIHFHKHCSYSHLFEEFAKQQKFSVTITDNRFGFGGCSTHDMKNFNAPAWDTYISPKDGLQFSSKKVQQGRTKKTMSLNEAMNLQDRVVTLTQEYVDRAITQQGNYLWVQSTPTGSVPLQQLYEEEIQHQQTDNLTVDDSVEVLEGTDIPMHRVTYDTLINRFDDLT